jgi:hypothetical protein
MAQLTRTVKAAVCYAILSSKTEVLESATERFHRGLCRIQLGLARCRESAFRLGISRKVFPLFTPGGKTTIELRA